MTTPSRNHDWLAQTAEDALDPACPSAIRTITSGISSRRAWPRAICSTRSSRTSAPATTSSRRCSSSAARCSRPTGPEELRPVGETEFVNGVAAMSASGAYGTSRIAAGIVGTADLRLGDAVGAVLDAQIAAGGGRFRGIRRAAAWDPDPEVPNHRTEPGARLFFRDDFRAGFAQLARRQLTFEAWCYHRQIPDVTALARAFPDTTIILESLRRTARRGELRGQGEGRVRGVAHGRSPSWPRARTSSRSSAASTWR